MVSYKRVIDFANFIFMATMIIIRKSRNPNKNKNSLLELNETYTELENL